MRELHKTFLAIKVCSQVWSLRYSFTRVYVFYFTQSTHKEYIGHISGSGVLYFNCFTHSYSLQLLKEEASNIMLEGHGRKLKNFGKEGKNLFHSAWRCFWLHKIGPCLCPNSVAYKAASYIGSIKKIAL